MDLACESLRIGTTTADAGDMRCANARVHVAARNQGGSANIKLVQTDSSDRVLLGDPTNGGTLFYDVKTGSGHEFRVNGTPYLRVTATTLGFFGVAAVTKQSVTGVLSAVADANAKAVLTSIIAALVNYGLVTDKTT